MSFASEVQLADGPWTEIGKRLPTQWVLIRIALQRQFRTWRLWWVFLAIGQLLFAGVIVFAFSTLFPRVSGRGGTLSYAFSVYAGILTWSVVQDGALQAMNLFRDHRSYIMRFRVPLWSYAVGGCGVRAIVWLTGFVVLLLGQLLLDGEASWRWVLAPVALPVLLALSLGVAWIVAVLTALEPRIQQLLPHVFLLWFFATPVVYPREMLPGVLGRLAALNPMAHVVESLQSILVVGAPARLHSWVITVVVSLGACALGLLLLRAKKRALMDSL